MAQLSFLSKPSPDGPTDRSGADFRAASAHEWQRAALKGDVSCTELVTTALTAAATQAELGAFIHLDAEFALARADQQDAVLRRLRSSGLLSPAELAQRSPLVGLPVAFKDLTPVAGLPLTLGTRSLPVQVPAYDSPGARRVHRAGAISVGKTQVPEFGLPCYSENSIAAPARNPLNPRLTAGGSTGGGAAAVAAGMLPFAPGTDGGGSIRIPAAACGLVGLKPGRGRLPDDDASRSVTNVATSGPIGRSAEDAALLFDVMAGHRFRTSSGATSYEVPSGPASRHVASALRHGSAPVSVGVTTESPFTPDLEISLDDEAITALETGIQTLSELGHMVQGTAHCSGSEPFWPAEYHQKFFTLWTSKLGQMQFPEDTLEKMEPLTRYFAQRASQRDPSVTADAIAYLQEQADEAEEIFGPWDVLLTPMLAHSAPEIGWFSGLSPEENYAAQCQFTPYSSVVNVLGLPAINVPMHTSDDGLSWSVQLIGKKGSEAGLLGLAATMMREAGTEPSP